MAFTLLRRRGGGMRLARRLYWAMSEISHHTLPHLYRAGCFGNICSNPRRQENGGNLRGGESCGYLRHYDEPGAFSGAVFH